MKKLSIGLLLFLVFTLVGCSQQKEPEVPKMVEVNIQTPNTINPNEEITIKAFVTQGEDKVDDADEVKFEIWKSGQDDHEMLDASHQDGGIYFVKKTFPENGIYYVISHVTARDMHTMPKKKLIVGTPSAEEEQADADHSDADHHDHEQSDVAIELHSADTLEANKEVTLVADIKKADQALTEAIVTFEIWQGDQEKHEFIDAPEGETGEYSIMKTFTSEGSYQVKVHVKKDELHEHKEQTMEVK